MVVVVVLLCLVLVFLIVLFVCFCGVGMRCGVGLGCVRRWYGMIGVIVGEEKMHECVNGLILIFLWRFRFNLLLIS